MPCEHSNFDTYWGILRYMAEPYEIKCNFTFERSDETIGDPVEPDEHARVDNRMLYDKMKSLQKLRIEQGYLTLGDLLQILSLEIEDNDPTNPYYIYCGDTVKYRNDMEKLAVESYRRYRKGHDMRGLKTFNDIQKALDDLDNAEKDS